MSFRIKRGTMLFFEDGNMCLYELQSPEKYEKHMVRELDCHPLATLTCCILDVDVGVDTWMPHGGHQCASARIGRRTTTYPPAAWVKHSEVYTGSHGSPVEFTSLLIHRSVFNRTFEVIQVLRT